MYRPIKHLSALLITALAVVQCTVDPTTEILVGGEENGSLAKIVNASTSAEEGTMLVKFGEDATRSFESASRNGGVTRSNIEPLNNILVDINAVSIERLFPVDVRHEERTRKAGLHRWYIVKFDKGQSLDKVARSLSALAEVEKVEYNTPNEFFKPELHSSKIPAPQVSRLSTPQFNDPLAYAQWDLNNTGNTDINPHAVAGMDINAHEAWKYTTGDSSIVVAVMDQGVDYTHEDLAANMWVNEAERDGQEGVDDDQNGYIDDIHGYNFADDGDISWNKFRITYGGIISGDIGHGTHVAGTISAVNNNGIGISSIAGGDGSGNGVRIMSMQIISGDNTDNATPSVIARAFKYAADNGASLSNNSWGSVPNSVQNDSWYMAGQGVQQEAIDYFCSVSNHPNLKGGVVFFAAGNNGYPQSSYPGAYREHISVTAFAVDGYPAYYTNYGNGTNISAPGGDLNKGIFEIPGQEHTCNGGILSTISDIYYTEGGGKYLYYQGTSMACPHVTGVAALGLAYAKKINKVLTADEFKTMILHSVNDIDEYMSLSGGHNAYLGKMGTGRIDAFKMLMSIEGITCIDVPVNKVLYGIDITPYIYDGNLPTFEGSQPITIVNVSMSKQDIQRLNMSKAPEIINNKIRLTCRNTGCAIIEVQMVAGGTEAGSSNFVGGMIITRKFALIVRDGFAENGGWL